MTPSRLGLQDVSFHFFFSQTYCHNGAVFFCSVQFCLCYHKCCKKNCGSAFRRGRSNVLLVVCDTERLCKKKKKRRVHSKHGWQHPSLCRQEALNPANESFYPIRCLWFTSTSASDIKSNKTMKDETLLRFNKCTPARACWCEEAGEEKKKKKGPPRMTVWPLPNKSSAFHRSLSPRLSFVLLFFSLPPPPSALVILRNLARGCCSLWASLSGNFCYCSKPQYYFSMCMYKQKLLKLFPYVWIITVTFYYLISVLILPPFFSFFSFFAASQHNLSAPATMERQRSTSLENIAYREINFSHGTWPFFVLSLFFSSKLQKHKILFSSCWPLYGGGRN